ncbi:MAG: hypothetical protein ACLP6G_24695 [Terriglobales bacterium]
MKFLCSLCVLLIAFTGAVQAIHVHADNSQAPNHTCSICSVAHSGLLGNVVQRPAPLVVRAVVVLAPDTPLRSSEFASSLHIRPPPTA